MVIVLAMDEGEAAEEFAWALEEAGYGVSVGGCGSEAVYLTRRMQPALVLLTPRLPVMDGITALQYIRADHRTRNITAWVLSDGSDEGKGLGGFDHVLNAAITPGQLVSQVSEFLR